MAKGSEEKQIVIDKILEIFENSFLYNGGKEIRIPLNDVQIKVQLTCAKDNVAVGGDVILPGTKTEEVNKEEIKENIEPSQEELGAVSDLMSALGL